MYIAPFKILKALCLQSGFGSITGELQTKSANSGFSCLSSTNYCGLIYLSYGILLYFQMTHLVEMVQRLGCLIEICLLFFLDGVEARGLCAVDGC